MLEEVPTIEAQKAELERNGWKEMRPRWIWKSPNGALWIGPHGAWKAMRKLKQSKGEYA